MFLKELVCWNELFRLSWSTLSRRLLILRCPILNPFVFFTRWAAFSGPGFRSWTREIKAMDIPARWKSLKVESISRVPFDEWRETVQKARETFFPPRLQLGKLNASLHLQLRTAKQEITVENQAKVHQATQPVTRCLYIFYSIYLPIRSIWTFINRASIRHSGSQD